MDPNETLRLLRQARHDYMDGDTDAADRLLEYCAALDKWLSDGGFFPDAWKPLEPAPSMKFGPFV